jgi:hypothetical protein
VSTFHPRPRTSPRARQAATVVLAAALVALTGCSQAPEPAAETSSPVPEGDTSQQYAERAASLAQEYDIQDPPQVDIVRTVTPEETDQVQAQCMQEAGWPANVLPDGGVEYDYAAEQEPEFNLALYTCLVQYPPQAHHLGGMDEQQWSTMYDHLVNVFVPCAEREGFDVGEIPSKETYLAQPDGQKWFPGSQIARTITTGGSDRYTDVEQFQAVCPPTPDPEDLYGLTPLVPDLAGWYITGSALSTATVASVPCCTFVAQAKGR